MKILTKKELIDCANGLFEKYNNTNHVVVDVSINTVFYNPTISYTCSTGVGKNETCLNFKMGCVGDTYCILFNTPIYRRDSSDGRKGRGYTERCAKCQELLENKK